MADDFGFGDFDLSDFTDSPDSGLIASGGGGGEAAPTTVTAPDILSSLGLFNTGSAGDPFGPFTPNETIQTSAPTNLFDQYVSALIGTQGQNGQGAQPGLLTGPGAQAGIAGLGVGAGLLGLIQQLASGGPVTTVRQQTRTTPQEQQLTGQTLQALQGFQGLAHNAEINNAVKQLAAGQLPISPDLVKQVTSAFGATAGQLAQDSINNARERGFSGGTELLAGAGSPQYAQSLAQLQSDVSNALVNLAVGLPQTASNIQSQQVGNAAQGIGLQNDLLRALTQQNGFTQTSQTSGTLNSALGPFAQTLGATGGLLSGLNSFNRPQQQPITLNLGPGLSGFGGGGLSG